MTDNAQQKVHVVIPKGTLIYSTAPNWPSSGRRSKRVQTVQSRVKVYGNEVRHIRWSGAGGYWKTCTLPVDRQATT